MTPAPSRSGSSCRLSVPRGLRSGRSKCAPCRHARDAKGIEGPQLEDLFVGHTRNVACGCTGTACCTSTGRMTCVCVCGLLVPKQHWPLLIKYRTATASIRKLSLAAGRARCIADAKRRVEKKRFLHGIAGSQPLMPWEIEFRGSCASWVFTLFTCWQQEIEVVVASS